MARRIRRAFRRCAWLLLAAASLWLSACADTKETPATQVIVAITSDLAPEATLGRVEVTLSRRDGSDVSRMQDFTIVAAEPEDGEYVLPLTFSVVPGEEASFLITITGYGPLGAGGAEEKLVEQRAIATFEPETTLLLRIFLGRICLRNFCGGDDTQVCYAADILDVKAGQCGELLAFEPEDLETVDLELLPDLSLPPDGAVVLGTDGGAEDAGGGAGSAGSAGSGSLDGGVDAGCVGDDCPCTDDDSCDDELYCTIDACEDDGECSHEPRVCKRDDSACTRPPQCDERENACVEAFDSASLTSLEHCGSSATSSCETCEEIDEFDVSCVAGRCRRECSEDDVFDANDDPDDGCECTITDENDLSDDEADDSNCDGADGQVGDGTLYVTPEGSGDGDGSSPENAATLEEAFARAQDGEGLELLLASGEHVIDAPLDAIDGMVIFGGYAEDFRSRSGETSVFSTSPVALRVEDAVGLVTVDSVDLTTADQDDEGLSNRTITVKSSKLVLRRLTVIAGEGGPGAAGATGATGATGSPAGVGGQDAPSATMGGAAGGAGLTSQGGAGGTFDGVGVNSGANGHASATTGASCGLLGGGGPSAISVCGAIASYNCSPGVDGQQGCAGTTPGTNGAGAGGPGMIVDGAWVPYEAQNGGMGSSGARGGGAGGGAACKCSDTGSGASGGGGGEGGEGGGGGQGGRRGGAGGASIAIAVEDSTLTFEDVSLVARNGGDGGQGGDGGPGGAGALGGEGGDGATNAASVPVIGGKGGRGGRGGTGAKGGCGGGGVGGPSVAIFGTGSVMLEDPVQDYAFASGGAPGEACASGGGSAGNTGPASMTFGF